MKIEEILKKVEQIKKSDNKDELINELDNGLKVFSETYKSEVKTKDDTLTDLGTMKEKISELKKAFGIDESTSYKDALSQISKKKEELDGQVSTLGSSTTEQTKLLATLKAEFESLKNDHGALKNDLQIKEQTLANETFESRLKESFGKVGEMNYFGNVKSELSKMIEESKDKSIDEVCTEYVTSKPIFARKETREGGGGTPPPPPQDIKKELSMLELMESVGKKE